MKRFNIMQPIYFPFTNIFEPALAGLALWDIPAMVYAPSKHHLPTQVKTLIEDGRIALQVPVDDEDDRLGAALNAYHDWTAQLADRRGSLEAFWSAYQDWTPFFDDTYIANIRTAIKRPSGPAGKEPAIADELFQARMFLLVAQQFDQYRQDVSQDLAATKKMEKSLFNKLKGDPDSTAAGEGTGPIDYGARLTIQRLKAFSRLFLAGPRPAPWQEEAILITDSRAIYEELLERVQVLETVLAGVKLDDFNDMAPRRELLQYLAHLLRHPQSPLPAALKAVATPYGSQETGTLTVAVAPGIGLDRFFKACLTTQTEAGLSRFDPDREPSTLVGLVS